MGICTSFLEISRSNRYHEKELEKESFDDLKVFTLKGLVTKCKVVDIYDGDTVTLCFFENDRPIKRKFRMHGFDAPEVKPMKITPNYELHKQAGAIVRDKLKEKILNKILWVLFMEEEKYGRAMGNLYEIEDPDQFTGKELCINTWILENKWGKSYDGGKKDEFTSDELHAICNFVHKTQ
jgi:endonuclease YncB( thermonuclease family)